MNDVFDAYSAYYDLLYADKDYAGEATYIDGLIRQHSLDSQKVLELGCGTGAHAEHLAGMGYTVMGIDSSNMMLERALDRKRRLPADISQNLSFSEGDIRSWRSPQTFDVVISLFHVFGYQTSNQDLQSAFDTAAAQLRPGGLLIFDYWYGPAVLSQAPEVRVKRMEDEGFQILRIAEPTVFTTKNLVQVDFSVQIKNKKTTEWHSLKETHNMRYLFCPEICSYAEPDFVVLKNLAWMKSIEPTGADWAGLCVLKKH